MQRRPRRNHTPAFKAKAVEGGTCRHQGRSVVRNSRLAKPRITSISILTHRNYLARNITGRPSVWIAQRNTGLLNRGYAHNTRDRLIDHVDNRSFNR